MPPPPQGHNAFLMMSQNHPHTEINTPQPMKMLAIDLVCALCRYCHGKLHTEIQKKVVKIKIKSVVKKMESVGSKLLSPKLTDYCPTAGGEEE